LLGDRLTLDSSVLDDGFVDVAVEGKICPFDKLRCDYVSSCDEVLSLIFGLDLPKECPRAIVRRCSK
jgi:hypothetical protein